MLATHRTIDAVALRVLVVALGLWLAGCAHVDWRVVGCTTADVATAAPVAPVALAGAVGGLAACR